MSYYLVSIGRLLEGLSTIVGANLNHARILVCIACVFACSLECAQAYDYRPAAESEKLPEADREIRCAGLDAIDIGVKNPPHQGLIVSKDFEEQLSRGGENMYFTREQVTSFLQSERHMNLLIVHVAKFKIGERFELAKIRPFLESLGYKRIFVTGDRAFFPFPVLLDEVLTDSEVAKIEQRSAASEQARPAESGAPIERH